MESPNLTASSGHPGERVLLLRNRRGWTQDELAQAAGVGVDSVRRIEQGKSLRVPTLDKLAAALKTTTSYLCCPID